MSEQLESAIEQLRGELRQRQLDREQAELASAYEGKPGSRETGDDHKTDGVSGAGEEEFDR